MTTPAKMSDWRERAPATLFRADAETEPPTGMPWKMPDEMFAMPWPEKSRDVSG
jgi:hypothetical protein